MPVRHTLADYPESMTATMWNQFHQDQDRELRRWIRGSRLDGFVRLVAAARDDPGKQAVLAGLREHVGPAMADLTALAAVQPPLRAR